MSGAYPSIVTCPCAPQDLYCPRETTPSAPVIKLQGHEGEHRWRFNLRLQKPRLHSTNLVAPSVRSFDPSRAVTNVRPAETGRPRSALERLEWARYRAAEITRPHREQPFWLYKCVLRGVYVTTLSALMSVTTFGQILIHRQIGFSTRLSTVRFAGSTIYSAQELVRM